MPGKSGQRSTFVRRNETKDDTFVNALCEPAETFTFDDQ
jgi:hypothetical protein